MSGFAFLIGFNLASFLIVGQGQEGLGTCHLLQVAHVISARPVVSMAANLVQMNGRDKCLFANISNVNGLIQNKSQTVSLAFFGFEWVSLSKVERIAELSVENTWLEFVTKGKILKAFTNHGALIGAERGFWHQPSFGVLQVWWI